MRNAAKRLGLAVAVLGLMAAHSAHGSLVINSFGPTSSSPIYEGDTVTLRLAIGSTTGDFLGGSGTVWADANGGETHPAPVVSGISLNGSSNDGYVSFQYGNDGVANVSVSGGGSETYTYYYYTYEYLYSRSYRDSWGNWHYEPVYGYVAHSAIGQTGATFAGGTSFTVLNVAPTISSLTSNLSVLTGETFGFAATASDPGVFDILSFDWDFDGNGSYDDYSGASGSWAFSTAGDHGVSLRVSDGDGGFAYGSFDVTTSDAPVSAVPEPSSIALACSALPMGLGLVWKRRRKAVTA